GVCPFSCTRVTQWVTQKRAHVLLTAGYPPRRAGCGQRRLGIRLIPPNPCKSACSLRQRHLELDLRQLLRRLAELAQEREPAPVGMDLVEQVLRHDFANAGVAVLDCLVEPREGLVSLAAEGVDVSDVVGR